MLDVEGFGRIVAGPNRHHALAFPLPALSIAAGNPPLSPLVHGTGSARSMGSMIGIDSMIPWAGMAGLFLCVVGPGRGTTGERAEDPAVTRWWGSRVLFPTEPRDFPGRRGLKIVLRALHVLCAGILTGGYVFDLGEAQCAPWLLGTIASGVSILLLDLHETAAFLMQVRGFVVLGKLGLLAALPLFGEHRAWVLVTLLVVSTISSHAPSRIRYRVIGSRRVEAARTRG